MEEIKLSESQARDLLVNIAPAIAMDAQNNTIVYNEDIELETEDAPLLLNVAIKGSYTLHGSYPNAWATVGLIPTIKAHGENGELIHCYCDNGDELIREAERMVAEMLAN